ncbi:uncharacterized protein A4U43_C07F15920 [Asparagus officinalis]|uniref:Uncharacterized protein n=1 Tax=Asparagus officinalis TaxID=4686 RepID=A0A5P1ECA3_ASPOF|nr:uncharacterized protein A4U43_C07F15920 [Asparagus officinalis]
MAPKIAASKGKGKKVADPSDDPVVSSPFSGSNGGALDVEGDSDRRPLVIEVAPSSRGTRDRRRDLADFVDVGLAGESSLRPGPSRRPSKESIALVNEVDGANESSPGPGDDAGEGSLKEMSSNNIH